VLNIVVLKNSPVQGLKGRTQLNDIPNNDEMQNNIALQRAQSSLDLAVTALQRDPSQISIQYETDKLSFEWRQRESALVSSQLNLEFVAKEYVRAQAITEGKLLADGTRSNLSFNVKA